MAERVDETSKADASRRSFAQAPSARTSKAHDIVSSPVADSSIGEFSVSSGDVSSGTSRCRSDLPTEGELVPRADETRRLMQHEGFSPITVATGLHFQSHRGWPCVRRVACAGRAPGVKGCLGACDCRTVRGVGDPRNRPRVTPRRPDAGRRRLRTSQPCITGRVRTARLLNRTLCKSLLR